MLTVTFAAARRVPACAEGYDQMAAHLGGDVVWGMDRPIPLLEVLEVCGLDDALWALRIAEPVAERNMVSRLLACDCAEWVLPIFEAAMPGDSRPRQAIEVSRRYARGEATSEELMASSDSACAAERAARAAGDAAWGAERAAWDAAWAAERAARAAGDAARAAERAARAARDAGAAGAAERQWQAARLRQYLTGEVQPCE